MKNKVTVSIAGQEYTMVAAEDESYVRKVAAHVDGQVREVMDQGRLSLADSAVLAAMNIADQYYREQAASENLRRQSTAKLRLAHPGGPSEQQAGNGPVPIPNAGISPAHRLRHGADGFLLAHHLAAQQPFQAQQPLPFPGSEPPHRDPGPYRHRRGNVLPGHSPAPLSFGIFCRHNNTRGIAVYAVSKSRSKGSLIFRVILAFFV